MFKHIAIAAAAVALTAGAASANNTFGILSGAEQGDSFYDVGLARTTSEGSVQIETLSGDVLGMAALNAGTNTDVRVDLGLPASGQDLVAKLIVDGVVVDEKMIDVRR
ncbi:MAG: hypothetical protein AAF714_01885 [Pseudomonadota bacterium]